MGGSGGRFFFKGREGWVGVGGGGGSMDWEKESMIESL